MEDEPQAEDQPAGVDEETETVGPEDGDEAELTPAESPGWRKKRRDRRDSDSDTSLKALQSRR